MKNNIAFIICLFIAISVFSQEVSQYRKAEAPFAVPFFAGSVGWTFPAGEMGNRYSSFMNSNANLGWKLASNWVVMADATFQFGNQNDKMRQKILSTLIAKDATDGFIISGEGSDAGVASYSRHLSGSIKVGRIFSLSASHPNSGIMLSLSGGYLQYQTIFMPTIAHAPQIEGDYAKGYDRQMRGWMGGIFIGYWHMSRSRFTNFYAGIEANLAVTHCTRAYQFDLQAPLVGNFFDRMYTLKAGWIIPFHGRSAEKIYYH